MDNQRRQEGRHHDHRDVAGAGGLATAAAAAPDHVRNGRQLLQSDPPPRNADAAPEVGSSSILGLRSFTL